MCKMLEIFRHFEFPKKYNILKKYFGPKNHNTVGETKLDPLWATHELFEKVLAIGLTSPIFII